MKEFTETSHVCSYLEKMFRQMNQDFFDGKLEKPVITICSTPKSFGHVSTEKVWKSTDTQHYELNIDSGTLNRPIERVVSTLLHEMVHIYNLQNGISDCSRNGTYHNRYFKEAAEKVGLIVEKNDVSLTGYSITSPSDSLFEYIAEQGWRDIPLNRDRDPKAKRKSSTRKYICPRCGDSVRATKTVALMCITCQERLILSEKAKRKN